MKSYRLIIALLCLVLPTLIRNLWFYQGSYSRKEPVATPDYSQIELQALPLSTPVTPAEIEQTVTASPVVLLDIAHDNMFSLSEIEPFTQAMIDAKAEVRLNDDPAKLTQMLKDADAYVVIAPTLPFEIEEQDAIGKFVNRGGRLLVITDPTRDKSYYGYVFGDTAANLQSVTIANTLLESYQTAFVEDYLYDMVNNEANFRHIILTQFNQNTLVTNLKRLIFYSAHSIRTGGEVLVRTADTTRSSLTDKGDNFAVVASAANGQVIAIGDMTFMTRPYVQVADNQLLLKNLVEWLSKTERVRSLEDIPYIFVRPVTLMLPKDITLNQQMLEIINATQQFLTPLNLRLTLNNEPQEDHDLIIVGTYQQAQTKVFQPFIRPFNLEFAAGKSNDEATLSTETPQPTEENEDLQQTPTPTEESQVETARVESKAEETAAPSKVSIEQTVMIPGIGRFSLDGIGLVLYKPGDGQNTLILLANSENSLGELSLLLLEDGLSDCLVQGNVAVCPVAKEEDNGYRSGD